MTVRRAGGLVLVMAAVAALVPTAWLTFPGWFPAQSVSPQGGPEAESDGRRIKARLFYVSEDGTRLTVVERDVAYADNVEDQAREIISAQIAPAIEPHVSAVPPGARLRALFVTPGGEAFVDMSAEMAAAHPGGSLNELLTIYTIVNALTVNLPSVTAVQVLIDGKEVDTLAGHVDLRSPLARNLAWLQDTESAATNPESQLSVRHPDQNTRNP